MIVIPTTNLALTLKSNTMKNSLQNYKIFFKTMLYNIKIFYNLTQINLWGILYYYSTHIIYNLHHVVGMRNGASE